MEPIGAWFRSVVISPRLFLTCRQKKTFQILIVNSPQTRCDLVSIQKAQSSTPTSTRFLMAWLESFFTDFRLFYVFRKSNFVKNDKKISIKFERPTGFTLKRHY